MTSANRRQLPSNRRQFLSDRRGLPSNRRRLPSNRRQFLSDRRGLPSNRRRLPSNRRQFLSDRRGLPSNRRRLPSNRRQFLSDRRGLPSNRRQSTSPNPTPRVKSEKGGGPGSPEGNQKKELPKDRHVHNANQWLDRRHEKLRTALADRRSADRKMVGMKSPHPEGMLAMSRVHERQTKQSAEDVARQWPTRP